ncbi:MAG TPA: acyl-CoA dehydrogenase, partial [Deltaproteobacteria bacterium]|nr:acyl-CoA dehydrogenase [Deltaproteobacteria bacterium]
SNTRTAFDWADPMLFNEQLTEEERLIRDTARNFSQDKLMPRVLEAN